MGKRKNTSFRSMNHTVAGVDLGDTQSVVTVLSPAGDVMDRFTFQMDDAGYLQFADRVPKHARVAFEATGMAYPVYRAFRDYGYDVTVAHPKDLAWIVKSKKKNDTVDSLKIARLHMVGMLPESHLLDRGEQMARDLLVQRVKTGVEIGRLKTSIIGYLKREGVYHTLPDSADNFSDKRRSAIKALKFDDDRDLVLQTMMNRLDFLEKQCIPLEDRIRKHARESDDVKLIMTIKGVDYYLASLISSYIGDVNRFPSDDRLASYFGIVPANRDSASIKRRGRMAKEGPAVARWALSLMVDTVTKWNKPLRDYYLSVKNRTSSGSMAHASTSRKLVRMLYHMLKTRQHWKWENPKLSEKKIAKLGGDTG
jgi:transposase